MQTMIVWNGLQVRAEVEVEKVSYWFEAVTCVTDTAYELDDAEEFSAFLVQHDKPAEWVDMRHECETWLGTFEGQLFELLKRSLW